MTGRFFGSQLNSKTKHIFFLFLSKPIISLILNHLNHKIIDEGHSSSTVSLSSAQSNDCGWKKIHFNPLQLFPRITEHPSPLNAPHNSMQSRSNCRNMLFSLLCFGLNTNHRHVWPFIMSSGIIVPSEARSDGGSADNLHAARQMKAALPTYYISLQKETNEALHFLIITAHDSMSETNTAERWKWTIILVGWGGRTQR